MNTIYDAAKTSTKYRMLVGGVAFLRFGLSYTCDPDAHAAKQALPASTLPEVKVKILGFHGLSPMVIISILSATKGRQGSSIRQDHTITSSIAHMVVSFESKLCICGVIYVEDQREHY